VSTLGDMARNDAYYHPEKHKLVGVVIDPSKIVDDKGELDVDGLCDEILKWFEIQTAKIDAEKAAEGKKDG
jgi:hypothetical protein